MSEFTPLREAVDVLASRAASPDFDELKLRATRRGRRRVVMVATAGAVAFIAVGGGLSAGSLGSSDQLLWVGEPPVSSSESPPVQESAEPPDSLDAFGTELDAILEQVPSWAITDDYPSGYDYAFNGRCSGNWGEGATGGGDGGVPGRSAAGMGHLGFLTVAQASDAAARFVENLTSCTATEWRTQPIPRTGAVLASSPGAVAWIQRTGDTVDVLQVRTNHGPPPFGVQVEVAEWMVAYRTWQEQN